MHPRVLVLMGPLLAHGPFLLCQMEIVPLISAFSLWWLLWPRKIVLKGKGKQS